MRALLWSKVQDSRRQEVEHCFHSGLTLLSTTFAELLPCFVIATTRNKINKDIPALANSDRVFILSLRSCRKSIQTKGENVTSGTNLGELCENDTHTILYRQREVIIDITFQASVGIWRFERIILQDSTAAASFGSLIVPWNEIYE
jgi:hypothetical protein